MGDVRSGPRRLALRGTVTVAPAPPASRLVAIGLAMWSAAAAVPASEPDPALTSIASAPFQLSGQWRLLAQSELASDRGPLADAARLAPGTVRLPGASGLAQARLDVRRGGWQARLRLERTARAGGAADTRGAVEAWSAGGALGADAQWRLGRQRISWDVGQAFRPNDVVGQEPRRGLLDDDGPGRLAFQVERYDGADAAQSWVWVRPDHAGGRDVQGAEESALALRDYRRIGALDRHLFARWGRHTRASVGAAAAWVADDAVEVHASARIAQRHAGWRADGGDAAVAWAPPVWRPATRGGAGRLLLGASWTGAWRQSLLLEAWHDGQAPSDAQWRRWQAGAAAPGGGSPGAPDASGAAGRSSPPASALTRAMAVGGPLDAEGRRALAAVAPGPAPSTFLPMTATETDAATIAAALASRGRLLAAPELRQRTFYARLGWQPEAGDTPLGLALDLHLDLLWHPADGGRLWTAGARWQGDVWQLDAAARASGGPTAAVLRQLPARRSLVLAATRRF